MSNITKGTSDKVGFARQVLSAMAVQGPQVVQAFSAWLFVGDRPRKLSVEELVELVARRLAEETDALEASDLAHQVELGDDVAPRARRDAAVLGLRAELIAASELVRGAYGEATSRQMGLEAPLAERPDLLLKQARGIEVHLTESRELEPRRARRGISLSDVRHGVKEAADTLHAALSDVVREEREAQQTLTTRDAAEARWGVAYMLAGDVFAAMCRAAGLVQLADRVRPTVRRRAGIAEPVVVDPTSPASPTPTPTGE